jgi:hypothetical protein
MTRDLPTGRAENELQIEALEPPHELAIRTLSGPTPFRYRYAFSSGEEVTILELEAEVELAGPAALLGPVARRAVKRGVEENLATLKGALELRPPQR